MPIPYAIIKRVKYISARERKSGSSGGWIFCNRNNERYDDGNEGDNEEPLVDKEVVHLDIPAELLVVEL